MTSKNFSKISKQGSKEDLDSLLSEEREKLFELKMKHGISQMKNTKAIRESRKNIARILTQLSQST